MDRYWKYPYWLYKERYELETIERKCIKCGMKGPGRYPIEQWICTKCLKKLGKKCTCGLDEAVKHGATGGRHVWHCKLYEDITKEK